MRLPYAPADPSPSATASEKEIYARIAARRNPRPVTKLDRALLHCPPVANGWNELLGAIRTKTTLSQAIMEFSICRIAVLNDAVYEWSAHAPLAIKAGVKREVLDIVKKEECCSSTNAIKALQEREEGEKGLSKTEWAVLAYTDQMTRSVKVEDAVFESLKEWFDQRQIIELTATVASYNCVSRFLVALDVCEMNGEEIKVPEEA